MPVKMAAQIKERTVFDSSKTGIVGSNTARGMDMCFCVLLCCDVLRKYKPCVGLIPRPRSPIKCPKQIHKFQKSNSESEQAMMAYLEVEDYDK
jgi:hypothetical protein